jgi:PKD repeat protein
MKKMDFNIGRVKKHFLSSIVQFWDDSENAETWYWEFGAGATSNEQDPEHTYVNPG